MFILADLIIDMTILTLPNLLHDPEMTSPATIRPIAAIRIFLILMIVGFPTAVLANGRIVSVQSVSIPPYEEAIDGFTSVCSPPMDRFLTSDKHSVPLADQIRHLEPELILAVGLDALNALDDIQDIPIVFVMLLCPECNLASRANITGVNMTPSVDVQLCKIHDILPDVKRIGVVFNPKKTGRLVGNASTAAGPLGIDILAAPVSSAREVYKKLTGIRDRAQVIWMLPDVTVVTDQTIEIFLLFSIDDRIPLIAFSEKYVDYGAFMAFGLDPKDMGRQAGEMANMILSGESPSDVPIQEARKVSVTVKRSLAEKFGILLDEDKLETVKLVE